MEARHGRRTPRLILDIERNCCAMARSGQAMMKSRAVNRFHRSWRRGLSRTSTRFTGIANFGSASLSRFIATRHLVLPAREHAPRAGPGSGHSPEEGSARASAQCHPAGLPAAELDDAQIAEATPQRR